MRPEADYTTFLRARAQHGAANGFDPVYIPDFLYDFQKELADWAIRPNWNRYAKVEGEVLKL